MTHVAIVGAYGSAGVAVAQSLADAERDVELTLIDDGEPGGGLCILRGCMPSKAVLSAGAHRFQARHDDRLSGTPEVDLSSVVETKDEQVLGFAEHRRGAVHDLAEHEDVELIHETARFTGPHTLAVDDREIEADYVVIATGSTLNVPDLPGMEEVDPTGSAEVLDATDFPDSGIVMGFGYVGLELVPYLSEAGGMELTVIEHDDRPVDEAPPGYGDTILDLYREEFGIEILTNARERSVEPTAEGGVRMELERDGEVETIEADQLFTFTGRKPNLDGLGIENTDLSPEAGWVEDTMQARDDPRTFVVGDVNGHEPILHVAKEQGFRAAENVLAHAAGRDLEPYENVHHHVIFSGLGVYPFARLGHTADSAREAGYDPIEVSREASDDGVFKVKNVPEGLATLVVAQDGTVLGYQGLHHHADSMAKTMQIVVELGLDVRELPDRAYHPTLPEILDGLFREASAEVDE
ncbi:dihydrolipoyl dehydrogenase [Halalkalicoccus paucihalophilus]|uniref:Dihydrolipoyl dehydrogenase n=1 Tax=Halalkalicoccus paucihalophilus TaxID=1008153 RepID=A0A151AK32_9EURY|nr:NAD(P)/FAD-dependent oxidoreductase [Halalkalicoccus paucihalophilus]KYH27767.1 dihydrolipoyl dehydrogenase [Halalkalicoccus paucihalophilus]